MRILLLSILLLAGCVDSDKTETVSSQSGNLILTSSHGGSGLAWGLSECDSCHGLNLIHQQADSIRSIVQSKGYASCTGCHGSNGTSEARQCLICHNDSDLTASPIQTGLHTHSFITGNDAQMKDEACIDCHLASDMDGVFDNNRDLTRFTDAHGLYSEYSSVSEFCLRCHNRDHQQTDFNITADYASALIGSEDYFKYVDKHGETSGTGSHSFSGLREGYEYQTVVECTDCHAMHGTNNAGLVIDSSEKGLSRLDPAIRNKSYSIDNTATNNAQLCVMCHQMSVTADQSDLDTGNGLSGLHQITGDCKQCHSHGESIQAGM